MYNPPSAENTKLVISHVQTKAIHDLITKKQKRNNKISARESKITLVACLIPLAAMLALTRGFAVDTIYNLSV